MISKIQKFDGINHVFIGMLEQAASSHRYFFASVRLVLTCTLCTTHKKPAWYVEVVPAGSPTSFATVESGILQIEREVGKTAGTGHVLAPLFHIMLS